MGWEFRVFIPQLLSEDQAVLPPEVWYVLDNATRCLVQFTADPSTAGKIEHRTDSYVVHLPFFGVKLRAGKKVEVKIRKKFDPFNADGAWIDYWTKTKLGKKAASHYEETIRSLLVSSAHFAEESAALDGSTESLHRALDEDARRVTTVKARRTFSDGGISIEICSIELADVPNIPLANDALLDSGLSSSATRDWISVAIEGSSREAILQYLRSHSSKFFEAREVIACATDPFSGATPYDQLVNYCGYLQPSTDILGAWSNALIVMYLYSKLSSARRAAGEKGEYALNPLPLPVLGGYPLFAMYISGDLSIGGSIPQPTSTVLSSPFCFSSSSSSSAASPPVPAPTSAAAGGERDLCALLVDPMADFVHFMARNPTDGDQGQEQQQQQETGAGRKPAACPIC